MKQKGKKFKCSIGVLISLIVGTMQKCPYGRDSKTISDTVKNDTGAPIPGVNIIVKGILSGIQTDLIRHGKLISRAIERGLPAQDYQVLNPLLQIEINANANLVQNPGY